MTVQEAIHNATQLHDVGRLAEAEEICRKILSEYPDTVDSLHLLGVIAAKCGHFADATVLISRAITLKPDSAEFHGNLGIALSALGRLDEAMAQYEQALRIRPDYPVVLSNMGAVLKLLARLPEARDACRRSAELRPDFPEAHYNLGNALVDLHEYDQAISAFRKALEIRPAYPRCMNNLANALNAVGMTDDALSMLRRSLDADPTHVPAHSNLIFAMHYHPDSTAQMILDEQKRWDNRHARPLATSLPEHANDPSPDRRLKIGYVSSDFREHVIGWNLIPILKHHDHQNFEILCYSSVTATDPVADALRAGADVWRNVGTMDDDATAKLIREDQIDILVDLSLHTLGNRLLVFAREPAPIQISYLGYCGSAGLRAIDYRLSDPYLDNADTERNYLEKTIYLPGSYWCYRPGDPSVEPSPPPVLAAGHITFGCLNNFAKVSLPARKLWAEILNRVKDSRLLVHSPPGEHLRRARDQFTSWGIDPARIEFLPKKKPAEYLQSYGRLDIALDPFPYNGGITTCDALWMGVPVITLAGQTSVGRAGKSILSNIGLTELVAENPEQYIELAEKLAAGLRKRMLTSPLMDGAKFTRDLEAIYRRVWREWCLNCHDAAHG